VSDLDVRRRGRIDRVCVLGGVHGLVYFGEIIWIDSGVEGGAS
jgi:hypothetical protein